MSDSLFDFEGQEIETADDAVAQEMEVADEKKLRRKMLIAGTEELHREDFGDNEADWQAYSQQVEFFKSLGNEKLLQKQLKLLHSSSSPFSKYLPGGKVKKTREYKPKKADIPELQKYYDICKSAHEKFSQWVENLSEQKEVKEYLESLGYEGETPQFTAYWMGDKKVKQYIKSKFGTPQE